MDDSTRTPPISIPVTPSASSSASKKRGHRSESPATSMDEAGDVQMRMAPSRTPAISPDPMHGGSMPTMNPLTGLQNSPDQHIFENRMDELLMQNPNPTVTGEKPEAKDQDDRSKRRRTEASGLPWADTSRDPQPSSVYEEMGIHNEYNRLLGVGWAGFNDDPHVVAGVQGYCKFISNNYTVTNVEVMLKNKSSDAFLVKTGQGYFLFQEDLMQARLIARDYDTLLERLKGPNPQFEEGEAVIAAKTTPH